MELNVSFDGMSPLIQVFDMPTSLLFYRDILGFSVVQSSGDGDDVDWVLLQYNSIEIMLNTMYEKQHRPELPDPVRNKHHADITLYFGCPDIDALYAYLKAQGLVIPQPSITAYGWKAISFHDPDGYSLCFHYPVL